MDRPGFHDISLRLSQFPARGTGMAQPMEARKSCMASQHGQRRRLSVATAATRSLVLPLSCKRVEVLELSAYVAVLFHSQK